MQAPDDLGLVLGCLRRVAKDRGQSGVQQVTMMVAEATRFQRAAAGTRNIIPSLRCSLSRACGHGVHLNDGATAAKSAKINISTVTRREYQLWQTLADQVHSASVILRNGQPGGERVRFVHE